MTLYDFSKCDFNDDLIGKGDAVIVYGVMGQSFQMAVSNHDNKRVVFRIPEGKVFTVEGYTAEKVRHIVELMKDFHQDLLDSIKAGKFSRRLRDDFDGD